LSQHFDINIFPEYISCSQMARLLNLSRSRFYMLIAPEEGIFLPPIYNIETKRPFYTRKMAQTNLDCKRKNQGVNGKICMFYSARHSTTAAPVKKSRKKKNWKNKPTTSDHDQIKSDLESLGLNNISSAQISQVIKECFPEGTDGVDDGDIVRQVYLSIRSTGLRT